MNGKGMKFDVAPEFVKNSKGVSIKKCCASCALRAPYDNEGPRRKCKLNGKIMDKSDCCSKWVISEFINNITLSRR